MIVSEAIGETWQATMNLRILRIPDVIGALYGHSGSDTLQQEWFCLENGMAEWRDIVIVEQQ